MDEGILFCYSDWPISSKSNSLTVFPVLPNLSWAATHFEDLLTVPEIQFSPRKLMFTVCGHLKLLFTATEFLRLHIKFCLPCGVFEYLLCVMYIAW